MSRKDSLPEAVAVEVLPSEFVGWVASAFDVFGIFSTANNPHSLPFCQQYQIIAFASRKTLDGDAREACNVKREAHKAFKRYS
jgi:hypothetical protein